MTKPSPRNYCNFESSNDRAGSSPTCPRVRKRKVYNLFQTGGPANTSPVGKLFQCDVPTEDGVHFDPRPAGNDFQPFSLETQGLVCSPPPPTLPCLFSGDIVPNIPPSKKRPITFFGKEITITTRPCHLPRVLFLHTGDFFRESSRHYHLSIGLRAALGRRPHDEPRKKMPHPPAPPSPPPQPQP